MINEQLGSNADHDFDVISQKNCDYDREKGIQLDVEKTVGAIFGGNDVRAFIYCFIVVL